MEVWQSLIYGALGGFLNCILFRGGFVISRIVDDKGKWLCEPGFLGNIFIGAAAGFLIDAFMASELSGNKEIGLVLLGGVGGGSVLISFLQQHIIKVESDKAEALASVAEEVIKLK
jgi:hypothetical protein